MKDWLVCRVGAGDFWLTRIDVLPNGREEYLCGSCDGPLEDHVVAFFASSSGAAGTVASSICWRCDLLLRGDHDMPMSELDAKIELLLARVMNSPQ